MTREERFVKDRAWLKTHTFAVTNSLRIKIQQLPLEEQKRYCYIQNKVLISAGENQWASIASQYWRDKCRAHYRRYIERLVQWQELEVDDSYFATQNKTGFPKSYRVPASAFASGVHIVEFARKQIRPPTPQNKPTDEVSHYALECLDELYVGKVLRLPTDPIRRSSIRYYCERIAFKDFVLSYGKSTKRLFHNIVMMPSEGRCNLRHFFPLVEYDVRSCHPLLMLDLFSDVTERRQYAEFLSTDIYNAVGNDLGIMDREKIKVGFLRVVNSSVKESTWLEKQPVFNWFLTHFPICSQVIANRTDLACFLQNAEAELMIQQLGIFCKRERLFWIPQHDGWITIPEHEKIIMTKANTIISDAVHLTPSFTKHFLNDP